MLRYIQRRKFPIAQRLRSGHRGKHHRLKLKGRGDSLLQTVCRKTGRAGCSASDGFDSRLLLSQSNAARCLKAFSLHKIAALIFSHPPLTVFSLKKEGAQSRCAPSELPLRGGYVRQDRTYKLFQTLRTV